MVPVDLAVQPVRDLHRVQLLQYITGAEYVERIAAADVESNGGVRAAVEEHHGTRFPGPFEVLLAVDDAARISDIAGRHPSRGEFLRIRAVVAYVVNGHQRSDASGAGALEHNLVGVDPPLGGILKDEGHGVGQVVEGHLDRVLHLLGRSGVVPILGETLAVIDGDDLDTYVSQIGEASSPAAVCPASAVHIDHHRSIALLHPGKVVVPVYEESVRPLYSELIGFPDRLGGRSEDAEQQSDS